MTSGSEAGASDLDTLFCAGVAAIDAGDLAALDRLLAAHPHLASARLEASGAWLRDVAKGALDGFFRRPFLLWFVAEDPVRRGALPANIATVAQTIIDAARRTAPDSMAEQVQYALTMSALRGNAAAVSAAIGLGADLAASSPDLYPHATALHHAVGSGSLDAVRALVEAGAPLEVKDTVYDGTPFEWAEFGKKTEIAAYLKQRGAR